MKIKSKSNHEKMQLEHHHSHDVLQFKHQKYMKCQWRSFLPIICATYTSLLYAFLYFEREKAVKI